MNSKSLLLAAVFAAGLGVAGYLAKGDGNSNASAAPSAGEIVLAGLADRINDVSEIAIKTPKGDFHVKRQGETWVLVEKDGFPVQVDKVRSTLLSLSELTTVERKTDNPERYSALGVQSVGADPMADNQPKQIDLLDVSGEAIAALIIGKPRGGGKGGTFYVRRPTEMPSWLVKGANPELPESGDAWLDKKVIEIKREDVIAVQTVHVDGEKLTISKEGGDANFSVHDLPAGRELTYAAAADSIAGALQYVNFEDVVKAESFEAPDAPVSVVHFWTKDGIKVTVQCWEKEEQTFAAFKASYDGEGAPSLVTTPLPEAAEGEALAKSTPRSEEEMAEEIATLNDRLAPWVFQLPSYSKTNLTRRMDGLLKPLPEPEEAEETELDPDAPLDIDSLGGE